MLLVKGDIVGQTYNGRTPLIGQSNTQRINPWGSPGNHPPAAANNTDIISLNNSVIDGLKAGDIRKNYIMTGAIWTWGGQIPIENKFTTVGSTHLSNSTMETYKQSVDCFDCHSGSSFGTPGSGASYSFSHIWQELQSPGK